MRFLLALAPLALMAACGDVPVYVGDRLISGGPRPAATTVPGEAPGAPAQAAAQTPEGLTLFGQPVWIGDRRVGAPNPDGTPGGPLFDVPVWIGDTQVAGPPR